MSYSNFKDPYGLLKRMLLSRNKIAYSILFREVLNKLLVPIDYLLQGAEARQLKKERGDSIYPMFLILGGPRNGTTLLYQALAHYLPVSYVKNFIASFEKSPLTAYKLFDKFVPRSRESFQSYFGSVAGFSGPNDAFSIWNRWLGDDRNRIPNSLSDEAKVDMKNFFDAWRGISNRPFLNKNNRNSLSAPLLDSIFNNIYFIEIHRNPIYVAQSLIQSRKAVQGSKKIGWGLLSQDSDEKADSLAYIDDVCNQVYQVDKALADGRSQIDSSRYYRISYETFCEKPGEIIQEISENVLGKKISDQRLTNLQFSTNSNRQKLGAYEFEKICSNINNLYNKQHSDAGSI